MGVIRREGFSRPIRLAASCALPGLLAAILLVPCAAAFPGGPYDVRISLSPSSGLAGLALGALEADGNLRGTFAAAGVQSARFVGAQEVVVTEVSRDRPPRNSTFPGAVLDLVDGQLLWAIGAPALATVRSRTDYGLLVLPPGAPPSPDPRGDPAPNGTTVVFASPTAQHGVRFDGPEAVILPAASKLTIRDANGAPIAPWTGRIVNPGGLPKSGALPEDGVFVTLRGAWNLDLAADLVALPLGDRSSGASITAHLSPSANPALDRVVRSLASAGDLLSGADTAPLTALAPYERVLDGAFFLARPGRAEGEPGSAQIRFGAQEGLASGFAAVRGADLRIRAASSGETTVEGRAAIAVRSTGFAAPDRPLLAGLVPLAAAVLWGLALAALAYRLVRGGRAEKNAPRWVRPVGFLVQFAVLGIAFVAYDASFADSFGTSVTSELFRADRDFMAAGSVLALEMVPWSLGYFAFALPTALAARFVMRAGGRGKPYRGFARAAGLLALAILLPLYALALANLAVAAARLAL